MKKTYGTPLVEKIEFDESRAQKPDNLMRVVYVEPNRSLKPDEACGIELSGGVHTSNAYYDCGK